MDAVTKFNSSCVIILGFLNRWAGVDLVGLGVSRTGSVASLKISHSLNTDGNFYVCTLIVLLICLLVFKISFSLSNLSTGALNFGWNLGVCFCLALLV